MLTFSTDDIRPQDRFDHWCEVRCKNLFGVTIELEREQRASFRGRFSGTPIGSAMLAEMSASSYRVSRTAADIARVCSDSLNIGWQIRGPGHMETGRGHVQAVREGDFVVGHSELPFIGTPERSDGFHFLTLKIPVTGSIALGARTNDIAPAALPGSAGLTRLIAAMFKVLARQPALAGDPAGDVEHIARLVLLARGRLRPRQHESLAALRAGFLHAAREIVARDMHRPELTPAAVAVELGISLRQLHVLFEPTGRSFARTLTAMRLQEARRLLRAMPARAIEDIVFACGFDSIATFYRVFRSTYGMTPGDARMVSAGE